jgi:hypothetical protein
VPSLRHLNLNLGEIIVRSPLETLVGGNIGRQGQSITYLPIGIFELKGG